MTHNPAHALDGGIPCLSHIGRHRPAASDEHRWASMKAIVLCFVFAVCRVCFGAGDTNVIIMSEWSKPISLRNDQLHDASIRGRLLILQGTEPAYGGPPTTNSVMTFVELQNVSGAGGIDIDVYFDVQKQMICELTDSAGKSLPIPGGGWGGADPSPPRWVKLYYNSSIRLYVSPGTLAPLTIYPGGYPGRYWSISETDTNTYFLTGTLTLSTRTNLSLPTEMRESDYRLHGTATLKFPKTKIKAGNYQNKN
jgi:hypothetical protein